MNIKFAVLVCSCFLLASILLLSGSELLLLNLPGELPLGNVLSAMCFILPSVGVHVLMKHVVRFKTLRMSLVIAALLWLPLSIMLAGNPQFIFDDERFFLWLLFSVLLSLAIIFAIAHSVVCYIKLQKRQRDSVVA
jgi:hypothetical protein